MKPIEIDRIQITQEGCPIVETMAPIVKRTRAGTPLATQNASVQSRVR